RWLFNQAVCTLYAFCGVLFGLCSLTSLTVLSTVCCLKVCYPAYGRCWDALSDLYLHLSVNITPFSSFSYGPDTPLLGKLCPRAISPLAEWGSYGPEPYGTACCITWKASSTEATLYILALFIFCYLLPCLLILVSYSLILWTVRVSRRAVRQH
ncbi:OPN5 protein, partial [Syrrhaptes paradoxus]|nr:OPN5 protein [Syrrhaptes paradoxus]